MLWLYAHMSLPASKITYVRSRCPHWTTTSARLCSRAGRCSTEEARPPSPILELQLNRLSVQLERSRSGGDPWPEDPPVITKASSGTYL